jgi:alkanesulfonate monooxygenase SsuD/methylene tetrahydromethanopterin reductase-like flavin-dependent oxidoreductase (luciferase family)
MQLGLALPQYDFSVPGHDPLDWPTLLHWATTAEAKGITSLWLSDHIVWSIEKYGAAPGNHPGYDPLPTLAALARATTTAKLGTLVLAPIRPPAVTAKILSGIDRLSGGRLIAGLGAGWFEADYELTGQAMPPPGERLQRLSESIDVISGAFERGPTEPFDYTGRYHHVSRLRNVPGPVQRPRPPIWLGGRGPQLVQLAAAKADGWNTCWQMTPEEYAPRVEEVRRHLEAGQRDPDDFTLSLGLYTLVGEDERDLKARFGRLQQHSPKGLLDGMTLADYRRGRLVGTVEQVKEQLARWAELRVGVVIACLGAVPFSVTATDDLDPVVSAGT